MAKLPPIPLPAATAGPASAPAPNQAHNELSPIATTAVDPPVPKSTAVPVKGGVFDNFSRWLSQRNMRRAKYPAPFDRFFKELDFTKLCSLLLGSMVAAMTIFGQKNFNLVSKECMRELILMLIFALFFLTVAYTLQDMIPEISVAAMLAGIVSVVAAFHTVVFNLLDLSEKQRYFAVAVLVIGYAVVLLLTLLKLYKEDVREKEETKENGSHIAIAMV